MNSQHVAVQTLGLSLHHLNFSHVRDRMLSAWSAETTGFADRLPRDRWPFGRGLSDAGWSVFLEAMPVALRREDMAWLADEMSNRRFWVPYTIRMRDGLPHQARVNIPDAAVRLAHGEFNITYVNVVATLALEAGIPVCEVYRAGFAVRPRWSCGCLEGPGVSCRAVLEGHRSYMNNTSAEISIPAGPHCHHSIRVARWVQDA
jgi:hypothetical protein